MKTSINRSLTVEQIQTGRKKFVRYQEGARLYSMGIISFRKLAADAGAVYKVGKIVLINTKLVDDYLETCHKTEK